MNVLGTFLTCYQCLTDPITDLELDLKFMEKIEEKCEEYLKKKQPQKPRFVNIDKYTKNEIVMMDDELPSPNVDHMLEMALDGMIGDIHF